MRFFRGIAGWLIIAAAGLLASPLRAEESGHTVLLVVMDGLRPDYITSKRMPNLEAFAKRGVFCEDHHSVFPTVTRVNASSIATGCYPRKHGILGNTIYIPEVDRDRGLSTADAAKMQKAEEATGGKLLTAPSLGEILAASGKRLLIVSSGSTGSAFLLNTKVTGVGIISDLVLPASLAAQVTAKYGPPLPEAFPNAPRNARAVDQYIEYGLGGSPMPEVTILWLSDPDHTAHSNGIGSDLTDKALNEVDAQFGRVIKAIDGRGMKDNINVFVASDHGFSTHTGEAKLGELLAANGIKVAGDDRDCTIVEGSIYVKDHNREMIKRIVDLLERAPWCGAIFVERRLATHPEGTIPGTLSFNSAYGDHARRADIMISANWTANKNEKGWAGTTAQSGVAGHGTSSPYDVHATLVAAGPDIKKKVRSNVPTANIDLAPTILHILGLKPTEPMDGRILKEILKDGPKPSSVKVWKRENRSEAKWDGGQYVLTLSESSVDGTDYLNYTEVKR